MSSHIQRRAAALANEMSDKYDVSVIPVNCDQLKQEDVNRIFENILKEFPVKQIDRFPYACVDRSTSITALVKERAVSGGSTGTLTI